MGIENGGSYVKKILKSLCLSHGWSYGVFWRFDPRNHMLLTAEDAYYEGHAASLIDSMLLQVHMLSEGIIGESAYDGKHRWMAVNALTQNCKLTSMEISQLALQISSGIKTVAVIPVELRGVVEFGSMKEIYETPEFLDQARKFLQYDVNFDGLIPAGSNSLLSSSNAIGQNRLSASLISSPNSSCDDVSMSWANNIEGCPMFNSLHCPGVLVTDPSSSLLGTYQVDDLSQWLADSSKLFVNGSNLEAMLTDDMSSDLGGSNKLSNTQGKQPACSSQSSLTNPLDSCEEKPLVVGAINNEILTEFGMDFGGGELGDVINAAERRSNMLPIDTGVNFSECISEVGDHPVAAPKKGLFSELGLEQLLKDASSSSTTPRSCVTDQWPSLKKRRDEAYQMINDQFQENYHFWGVKLMQPISTGSQMQDFKSLKECMAKAQATADAKSSISSVNAQSKITEEPPKAAKKRARPGENTRPRPKDRQMISDRIKELRDLIPNGAKLSIDALLGRTIKHMLFMQNLKKHAGKLKQVDEPKLIGQDNGLIRKGSSTSISSGGSSTRGATWAYEVGGSNLLCPIVVEDLDEPGQMLIEMLCEERGYFLEIADIVRGFGLSILKGVMEARNDKIWAHFVVEGNKHITRMDVFVSLMQLLQGTNTSEVPNTACELANMIANAAQPSWGNFQQHVVPLPI